MEKNSASCSLLPQCNEYELVLFAGPAQFKTFIAKSAFGVISSMDSVDSAAIDLNDKRQAAFYARSRKSENY
jgi:hypothetical protein